MSLTWRLSWRHAPFLLHLFTTFDGRRPSRHAPTCAHWLEPGLGFPVLDAWQAHRLVPRGHKLSLGIHLARFSTRLSPPWPEPWQVGSSGTVVAEKQAASALTAPAAPRTAAKTIPSLPPAAGRAAARGKGRAQVKTTRHDHRARNRHRWELKIAHGSPLGLGTSAPESVR